MKLSEQPSLLVESFFDSLDLFLN